MLIVGAKGFATELLDVVLDLNMEKDLCFYDDVNKWTELNLFNKYPILDSIDKAKDYFINVDNRFCLGIGNTEIRKTLAEKFETIGGVLTSVISPKAIISKNIVKIGSGACILHNCTIAANVEIGKAPLIYHNVQITHDCEIGEFVELSPGATLLGRVKVGDNVQIGANATILPNIKIGNNVVVGAGAVVTKDVEDYKVVAGVPAKIIN